MTGANAKLRKHTMANVNVGVREKTLNEIFSLLFFYESFSVLKEGVYV